MPKKRLWLICQQDRNAGLYNIPSAYDIEGEFSYAILEKAVKYMVMRHAILRTAFFESEIGEPRQRIIPYENFAFQFEYYNLENAQNKEAHYLDFINNATNNKFNLERAPLFQLAFFQLEPRRQILFLNMHHIISDGWSMEIIARELFQAYDYYRGRNEHKKVPLRIQYKDYSVWHESLIRGSFGQKCREYWLNKLSGTLPVTVLPANKNNGSETGDSCSFSFALSADNTRVLLQVMRQQNVSTFVGALAMVQILLHLYLAEDDIVTGILTAGRDHPDLEDQLGFYVNTIALRILISKKQSFIEILELTRKTVSEALEHQLYPFDLIVEELNHMHDSSDSLKLGVLVDMQSNAFDAIESPILSELNIKHIPSAYNKAKFDLNFLFIEAEDQLEVIIKYSEDRYTDAYISEIANYFVCLSEWLAENSTTFISNIAFLPGGSAQFIKRF